MKKLVLLMLSAVVLTSACSSKPSFITDENGHKQYKDQSGNFVKDSWIEINGDKYFFDLNGYLVTKQWVQEEYYVDENGKMARNYWYDDGNGNQYYLTADGKYARNCILNIDNKEFAFDDKGKRAKNIVVTDGGKSYYFNNDYIKDHSEGWKSSNGVYFYVNKEGNAVVNDWAEVDGKWYHFNENGVLQTSTFIDDFYVDENGEMVCNKEINVGKDKYIFDAEGHGKIKEAKKIDFNELYNKYFYYMSDVAGKQYIYSNVKVSNNGRTLEVEPHNWNEIGVMESIAKMNKELGIPNSLVNRIKASNASDGMMTEKYGNIRVSWNAKEEYLEGWGRWYISHWVCYDVE